MTKTKRRCYLIRYVYKKKIPVRIFIHPADIGLSWWCTINHYRTGIRHKNPCTNLEKRGFPTAICTNNCGYARLDGECVNRYVTVAEVFNGYHVSLWAIL